MWNNICLVILDYIISICKYVKAQFFSIIKIYSIDEKGTKNNLYYKYLLLKYLSKIPFVAKYANTTAHLIKVEISNKDSTRDIIFKDSSLIEIVNNIPLLKKEVSDINEVLMHKPNCIVMDILLDKTSIKNLIEHYADRSKKYDHSLANVLKLKKKDYNEMNLNSKIVISYIESFERKVKEYNTIDMLDVHVSDLYKIV